MPNLKMTNDIFAKITRYAYLNSVLFDKPITENSKNSWILDIIRHLKKKTVISDLRIKVYLKNDAYPNASINDTEYKNLKLLDITTGFLKLPKSDVEAGLAHELGHLITYKKHPDLMKINQKKEHDEDLFRNDFVSSILAGLWYMWKYHGAFARTVFLIIASIFIWDVVVNIPFAFINGFMIATGLIILMNGLLYYLFSERFASFNRKLEYRADIISAKLVGKQSNIDLLKQLNQYIGHYNLISNHGFHHFHINFGVLKHDLFLDNHPTSKQRIKNIKSNC